MPGTVLTCPNRRIHQWVAPRRGTAPCAGGFRPEPHSSISGVARAVVESIAGSVAREAGRPSPAACPSAVKYLYGATSQMRLERREAEAGRKTRRGGLCAVVIARDAGRQTRILAERSRRSPKLVGVISEFPSHLQNALDAHPHLKAGTVLIRSRARSVRTI